MLAPPDRMAARADREQEIELFGEQLVVVVEVEAEQREGLDEGAAPGHDLGPAARQAVERGELLVDAHRIVGRQHRDGARETDALRARRARRERDRGRRDGVVRPVMLAEAEHVEPDAVGELDLLHEIGEGPVEADRFARRRIEPGLGEGVDAKFHQSLAGRAVVLRRNGMIAWRPQPRTRT